jgi:hypothetical protein
MSRLLGRNSVYAVATTLAGRKAHDAENDVQVEVKVEYHGEAALSGKARANIVSGGKLDAMFPGQNVGVAMPIGFHISGIKVEGAVVVVHKEKRVALFVRQEVSPTGRVLNPLRDLQVKISLGVESGTLARVEKLEKFLVEQVKEIVVDSIVYPKHILLDLEAGSFELRG